MYFYIERSPNARRGLPLQGEGLSDLGYRTKSQGPPTPDLAETG